MHLSKQASLGVSENGGTFLGPYDKGILLFGVGFLGSLIFVVNSHLETTGNQAFTALLGIGIILLTANISKQPFLPQVGASTAAASRCHRKLHAW